MKNLLLAVVCAWFASLCSVAVAQCDESNWPSYYPEMAGCDLSGANLYYANLTNADLTGADLTAANLHEADLSGTDLSGSNLTDTNLSYANLSGVDLSAAYLGSTNLYESNLSYANLSGANFYNVNLFLACLEGAVGFTQTNYTGTPILTGCAEIDECTYEDTNEDGYDDVSYTAGVESVECDPNAGYDLGYDDGAASVNIGDINNDGILDVLDPVALVSLIIAAQGK